MNPTVSRLAVLSALLFAGSGQGWAATGETPTGHLHVTVELAGQARNDFPNGIEWAGLTTNRTMSIDLAMLMPQAATGPGLPLGGVAPGDAPLPAGMATIAQAMEACGEDEACRMKSMMALGKQLQANPQALGTLEADTTRYETWTPDRDGACASGNVSVADAGDGVAFVPPDPARKYHFERIGGVELRASAQEPEFVEALCVAVLAVDRKLGLASLRLPAGGIAVPVELTGQAFTSEKRVEFLEGAQRIEVLDQPIDAGSKTWGGEADLNRVGSVSHNSGQVVVPVNARITWEFVRD